MLPSKLWLMIAVSCLLASSIVNADPEVPAAGAHSKPASPRASPETQAQEGEATIPAAAPSQLHGSSLKKQNSVGQNTPEGLENHPKGVASPQNSHGDQGDAPVEILEEAIEKDANVLLKQPTLTKSNSGKVVADLVSKAKSLEEKTAGTPEAPIAHEIVEDVEIVKNTLEKKHSVPAAEVHQVLEEIVAKDHQVIAAENGSNGVAEQGVEGVPAENHQAEIAEEQAIANDANALLKPNLSKTKSIKIVNDLVQEADKLNEEKTGTPEAQTAQALDANAHKLQKQLSSPKQPNSLTGEEVKLVQQIVAEDNEIEKKDEAHVPPAAENEQQAENIAAEEQAVEAVAAENHQAEKAIEEKNVVKLEKVLEKEKSSIHQLEAVAGVEIKKEVSEIESESKLVKAAADKKDLHGAEVHVEKEAHLLEKVKKELENQNEANAPKVPNGDAAVHQEVSADLAKLESENQQVEEDLKAKNTAGVGPLLEEEKHVIQDLEAKIHDKKERAELEELEVVEQKEESAVKSKHFDEVLRLSQKGDSIIKHLETEEAHHDTAGASEAPTVANKLDHDLHSLTEAIAKEGTLPEKEAQPMLTKVKSEVKELQAEEASNPEAAQPVKELVKEENTLEQQLKSHKSLTKNDVPVLNQMSTNVEKVEALEATGSVAPAVAIELEHDIKLIAKGIANKETLPKNEAQPMLTKVESGLKELKAEVASNPDAVQPFQEIAKEVKTLKQNLDSQGSFKKSDGPLVDQMFANVVNIATGGAEIPSEIKSAKTGNAEAENAAAATAAEAIKLAKSGLENALEKLKSGDNKGAKEDVLEVKAEIKEAETKLPKAASADAVALKNIESEIGGIATAIGKGQVVKAEQVIQKVEAEVKKEESRMTKILKTLHLDGLISHNKDPKTVKKPKVKKNGGERVTCFGGGSRCKSTS